MTHSYAGGVLVRDVRPSSLERANAGSETRYHFDSTANPWDRPSDVSGAVWLHSQLKVSEVPKGPHEVKIVLKQRNPQLVPDIVLTNVELVITYGAGAGIEE